MSTFGIICELNPGHKGHEYLLRQARKMGADRLVCVMSGNSVQRGSFAVMDKYTRAEAAIHMGADLVLELPFPWCSASAEGFARGALTVLKNVVDTVLFGSECGDLEALKRAADLASSNEFRASYREALRAGRPAAELYRAMLAGQGDAPLGANDLLGIEYLRVGRVIAPELSFATARRLGASYDAATVKEGEFSSATALRRLWEQGSFKASLPYLPEAAVSVMERAFEQGMVFSEERLTAAILSWFCLQEPAAFAEVCGNEGGLASRFCALARESGSLAQFYEKIKTKRYTDAHLRRVMLYCLTGVKESDVQGLPDYTTVLAANDRGRELLSMARKKEAFPILTKPADVPAGARQTILTDRLESLYSMGFPDSVAPSDMRKKRPYISKNG